MPWGCIPYSDIIAFVLCIFIYIVLCKYKDATLVKSKYLFALLAGLLLALDYLIKPSLVIIFIAFFIVMLAKKKLPNRSVIILLLTPILIITFFTSYQKNNSFVHINSSQSFSMAHFAAMGAYGNGGYSVKDVERDEKIKNPVERRKVDIKLWKKRISDMGVTGYQKFLINKQVANMSDGSFSWGVEGNFLLPNPRFNNTLSHRLFVPNGEARYCNFIALIIQTLWLFVLITILFSMHDVSFIGLLSKYAVVGFSVFLLIFEGGRSRYLIQFLPLLLLLSGIGLMKIRNFLHK